MKMPFELVKPSNSVPVTRTTEIWDAQGNTLDSLLAAINTQLAQGGGGSSEPIDLTGYVTTSVFNQQLALKANLTTVNDHADRIADLENALYPLTVAYVTSGTWVSNNGKYEYGSSIFPTAHWEAKKKTTVAISSATTGQSWGTFGGDNTTYASQNAVTLTSQLQFNATIVVDGQTKTLGTISWTPTFYRYYGVVDEVPTDYATAIRALATKELSTSKTLGSESSKRSLQAGKYFLFAVKSDTAVNFIIHDATGGTVSAEATGSVTVQQENGYGNGNTYYYVLVPASANNWSFYIE